MRSGFVKEHLMYFDRRKGIGATNYLEYMLSQEIGYEPGTHYLYSSGDAILATCMIEQVVGMSLHAYLYRKFFSKVEIDYPIWESDLAGHTCGASGLHLKLEDMAKLGCLYLNKGKLNETQFFDERWSDLSFFEYVQLNFKGVDESYGFYWRICDHGLFYKAAGAFGQDTLIFPKYKFVLAYQCKEGTDTKRLNEIIREELVSKIA